MIWYFKLQALVFLFFYSLSFGFVMSFALSNPNITTPRCGYAIVKPKTQRMHQSRDTAMVLVPRNQTCRITERQNTLETIDTQGSEPKILQIIYVSSLSKEEALLEDNLLLAF